MGRAATRFEHDTGHHLELAASGPKPEVVAAFRRGGVDVLTVHASDAIINVVADGLAVDPQPWLRNDLVLVGPPGDPAGIRGEPDALVALRKIIEGDGKLVVHASMGADGVLHDLLEAGGLTLPAGRTVLHVGERPQKVLARAAAEGAYTLVGRIPFVNGKLPRAGLELMVRGDPRLRRPYLVVIAAAPADDPHHRAARALVDYLRSPATQAWIATSGKGRFDDAPLFFPL